MTSMRRANVPTSRRVAHALDIALCALVLASCQSVDVARPKHHQFAGNLSRLATPAAAQHVFVLSNGIPADFASRIVSHGGSVVSSMPELGVVVSAGLSDDDASAIAGADGVAPDQVGQWIPTPDEMGVALADQSLPVGAGTVRSPQEASLLSSQWNMYQIHAPEAWATGATGLPSVRVAILDSGLDPDHVDQQGLIDDASSIALVPSTTGPPAWADDNLHGTFVGSIVTTNNIGTAGVAPNVRLIAVKVLDANGNGTIGGIIAGIYYATNVGAQVINLSLGILLPKQATGAGTLLSAMNRAVNYAKSRGVLVVSASGNDATDLQHGHDFVELPCEAGVQLCVSATGAGDVFEAYSNYGARAIDVAAPGGDPLTPIHGLCSSRVSNPRLDFCKDKQHYVFAWGTSAAAPHVSGLAAYLDSQYGGQVDPSELVALIKQQADDFGKSPGDPFYGNGQINVVNSLMAAHP